MSTEVAAQGVRDSACALKETLQREQRWRARTTGFRRARAEREAARYADLLAELRTRAPSAAALLANEAYDPTLIADGHPPFSQGRFLLKLGRFALLLADTDPDHHMAPLLYMSDYTSGTETKFDQQVANGHSGGDYADGHCGKNFEFGHCRGDYAYGHCGGVYACGAGFRDTASWFAPCGEAETETRATESVVLYVAYRLSGMARSAIGCRLGLLLLIRAFAKEHGLTLDVVR